MDELDKKFLEEVRTVLSAKCLEFGCDCFVFAATKDDTSLHLYDGGRIAAIGLMRAAEASCTKNFLNELT